MKKNYYRKLIDDKNRMIRSYKSELKKLKEELNFYKNECLTDSLTKLYNRRVLENIEIYNHIILGDVDHFKNINDMYGHNIGDEILIEISNIIKNNTSSEDLACRWGGEEFLIFLKNSTMEEAFTIASDIKEKIHDLSQKYNFTVTMSFGVSDLTGKTPKEAIEEADKAMYESKKNGRNKVTVYSLKN